LYIDLKDRVDYGFRGRPRCLGLYIDLKDRVDYGFSWSTEVSGVVH
jgi:hypothetical protein